MSDIEIELPGISSTASTLTLSGEYRIWTPDPDPWELHVFGVKGVWSTGDWEAIRSAGQARFMTDILDIITGATTHEIVLTLFFPPTSLPGNPFSTGQTGSGRTGTNSIHSSIPPSSAVRYKVTKA
jgi:hypothetical protein